MLEWLQHLSIPTNVTGPRLVAFVLFDVFLVVTLARLLGSAVARIGQPRVVGEILAGVLLGPTVLGPTLAQVIAPHEARAVLSSIATIALILFMFLAGVEYDASKLKGRGKQALIMATLSVAVPALLGFPVAQFMHTEAYAGPAGASLLPFALFIGAALSVTAFPVMAHILMERGELNSPIGGLSVATAGIMSVLMFSYIAFAGAVAAANGFNDFLLTVTGIGVFVALSWFGVRPLLARWLVDDSSPASPITGNGMALVFGGMVLFGLVAHLLKINALVGGFVWGMILPESRRFRSAIADKVRDVAMIFLLPIFFSIAGFSTDLTLITVETLPVVGVLLLAAIVGKFAAALPARAFGLTWREAGIIGALMNTRGLLVLVAGLIGLQLQIITALTFTMIVIVALVTNLMTLPLLRRLTPAK